MLLSVCIIARNEAEFLPECLESVVSVADEIILSGHRLGGRHH